MAVYDEKQLIEVMERIGMNSPLYLPETARMKRMSIHFTTIIPYYKGCLLPAGV